MGIHGLRVQGHRGQGGTGCTELGAPSMQVVKARLEGALGNLNWWG